MLRLPASGLTMGKILGVGSHPLVACEPGLVHHSAFHMLLKVAVHPNGGTEAGDAPIVQHWNTTAANGSATPWSLGRKAPSSCIVRNDKTISREHVRVSVAAAKKGDKNEEDSDEYTVSITNVGKLGSFLVVVDDGDTDTNTNAHAEEDGNDSDATPVDDHAVSQASASQAIAAEVPISNVSRRYLANQKAHLQPIDVNQTIDVILSTSTPKPILLQCGRSGTTIVMSWVSLAVSGNPAKQAVQDGVPVQVTENVHPLWTECVVTSKRSVCTKQLAAYCCGIPLVHPSYVQAIMEYDGTMWPDPKAHPPKPDNHSFWDEAPHDRTLWKACTFIRVDANSAVEQLVEAAGVGRVVDATTLLEASADEQEQQYVHLFAVQSSNAKIKKLKKELSIPTVTAKDIAKAITERRLLQDAKGNDIGVPYDASVATEADAGIAPAATVPAEASDNLHEQEASSKGSPQPKDAAKSSSNDQQLADAVGSVERVAATKPASPAPGPPPVKEKEENKSIPEPPSSSQLSNFQSQGRSLKKWEMDDSSDDEDIAPRTSTKSQPVTKMSSTPVAVAPAAASQPAPRAVDISSSSQWQTASQRQGDSDEEDSKLRKKGKRKIRGRRAGGGGGRRWSDSSDEEDGASPAKRFKSLSFVSDDKLQLDDAMDLDDVVPSSSQTPRANKSSSSSQAENQQPSPPKRRTVPVAPDTGWLTILPKDRARSRKEIMEMTGNTDYIGEPITEFAPSLLQQKTQDPRSVTPAATMPARTGPNFKTFRKNTVPCVYSGPPIPLRAVAEPKLASVMEADDEANAALAAQQRINDELFAGTSLNTTKKGRAPRRRR